MTAACQWRMLPRDFPPRSTVYGYFRAWIAAGVWAHVHDVLYRRSRDLEGRDKSRTAAIIESQSVKTGTEAHETVGFDAGKRVKGRKRHLVTDSLGLMLRIEVYSAGVQDREGAENCPAQPGARGTCYCYWMLFDTAGTSVLYSSHSPNNQ